MSILFFWLREDEKVPALELPKGSEDLMVPDKHILDVFSAYEILRHFSPILRLSPFKVEDFCAALVSEDEADRTLAQRLSDWIIENLTGATVVFDDTLLEKHTSEGVSFRYINRAVDIALRRKTCRGLCIIDTRKYILTQQLDVAYIDQLVVLDSPGELDPLQMRRLGDFYGAETVKSSDFDEIRAAIGSGFEMDG